jgi:hypothetical protein
MASSASSMSKTKSLLRPSSLTQHTLDFNKNLQQIPTPSIQELESNLNHDHVAQPQSLQQHHQQQTVTSTAETTSDKHALITTSPSKSQNDNDTSTAAPIAREPTSKGFVFGEKLSERVINAENPVDDADNQVPATADIDQKQQQQQQVTNQINTHHHAETLENNNDKTIGKFNCKLFVLDTDKQSWAERGYGLMKIQQNANSVKLCMWTDKSFRLILNIKLFDGMMLDKVNRKSIRLNGYDNGMLRIYLAKMANANDCDDLYDVLSKCIDDIKVLVAETNVLENTKTVTTTSPVELEIFKCDCAIEQADPTEYVDCLLHVLKIGSEYYIKLRTINGAQPTVLLYNKLDLIQVERKNEMLVFKSKQEQHVSSECVFNVHMANTDSFERFLDVYYEHITDIDDRDEASCNDNDVDENECSRESSYSSRTESENDYDEREQEEATGKRVFVNDDVDGDYDDDEEQNSKKAKLNM